MEKEKEEWQEKKSSKKKSSKIAKRDFTIAHNEYFKEIKKGDDLSDIPEIYEQNLKTEGVL